jgi:hypothetical protein
MQVRIKNINLQSRIRASPSSRLCCHVARPPPPAIVPELHGPVATESWAEEVCDLHAAPGFGKEGAIRCAQALDDLAQVNKEAALHHKEAESKVNIPGRCSSPSDEECDYLNPKSSF